jgi:hypothetical protein
MVHYLADVVTPGKFWVEYVVSRSPLAYFADQHPASSLSVCLANAGECQFDLTRSQCASFQAGYLAPAFKALLLSSGPRTCRSSPGHGL